MKSTMKYKLPYPESTDPVSGGAAVIQQLAEKTEEVLSTLPTGGSTLPVGTVKTVTPNKDWVGTITYQRVGPLCVLSVANLSTKRAFSGSMPLASLPTEAASSMELKTVLVAESYSMGMEIGSFMKVDGQMMTGYLDTSKVPAGATFSATLTYIVA